MAVAHRHTAPTAYTTATDPLAPAAPTGVAAGDLVQLDVGINSETVTIGAPTGGSAWTLDREAVLVGRNLKLARWYKIAGAGEPAAYGIDLSGAQRAAVAVSAYSGVDQVSPLDVSAGGSMTTLVSTHNAPSVTTSQADDLVSVGYCFANDAAATHDTSPAVTERSDVDANVPNHSTGDFVQGSAGATGTIDAGSSITSRSLCFTTAYRAAAVAGAGHRRGQAVWVS